MGLSARGQGQPASDFVYNLISVTALAMTKNIGVDARYFSRAILAAGLFALVPQRTRPIVMALIAGADGNSRAADVVALASGNNTVQAAGAARVGRQAL